MPTLKIIRIDPIKQSVAAITHKVGRGDLGPVIRKLIRETSFQTRQINALDVNGVEVSLLTVCAREVDVTVPSWKLPGCEDTAGISLLVGKRGPSKENIGGMVHAPVTAAWVKERIQWIQPESSAAHKDRAEETLPLLNEDVRAAIRAAVVTPHGLWISADHRQGVGDAMISLSLGTERSRGQMLTPLGETIFDMLTGDE